MLFDESHVRHAGVGQQHQSQPARFQLLQHRHDAVVQPEDVGGRVADIRQLQTATTELLQLLAEIDFRQFTAFHHPLTLLGDQELPNLLFSQTTQLREIAAHAIV